MDACGDRPMTVLPNWLPAMVSIQPWTDETFKMLYIIFERDFKNTQIFFKEFKVWFFPEKENGYELIFWHLTHKNDKETRKPTIPDLRRSERLPWAKSLIKNCNNPEVLTWDYEEDNSNINTYIWLMANDYLLLMKKYKDGSRRLLTSFYIDYPNYKRKLEKKYKARIK